ncbi:MAG: hypothetical protein EXR98_19280 [Gemmataceae bacterium]|nr:hypothetical protein [Gemmataceae bacterium]
MNEHWQRLCFDCVGSMIDVPKNHERLAIAWGFQQFVRISLVFQEGQQIFQVRRSAIIFLGGLDVGKADFLEVLRHGLMLRRLRGATQKSADRQCETDHPDCEEPAHGATSC